MKSDVLVGIGNFTIDLLNGDEHPGGSVYYCGSAAAALGASVRIATSATADFPFDLVRQVFDFDLRLKPSRVSTTMRNEYRRGRREQHVFGRAEELRLADVPGEWLPGSIVLLCPVFQELSQEVCREVRGSLTGASLQGWLRTANADNVVVPTSDVSFLADLAGVDVLFYSDEDVAHHAGLVKQFRNAAPIVVETRGPNGARVSVGGVTAWIPGYKVQEVDPTGAGDTFAAAFLLYYSRKRDPFDAARFATKLSAVEVSRRGPLTPAALREADNVQWTLP